MSGFAEQTGVSLRLYFRNKMGMFYGYLFPAIFLLAFWVLYRQEAVPLARHMGQLLTVTILGGACLGMPTTMVSERERGVWRRYRMTPASTRTLVTGAVMVRYVILMTAGLLQLALAMAIGMPAPRHPWGLCLAFTSVAFAFLGLGLVVATLADNVPSVQALGQCIFLPMLIVGGVAVPLAALPDWALHISVFLPGRYAVETLQACITGNGPVISPFDYLALLLIGLVGFIAGASMFRWDAQQRFASRGNRGKAWLVIVFAAWAAVGVVAEVRGRVGTVHPVAALPPNAVPVPVPPAALVPPVVTPNNPAPYAGPSSWQVVTLAEINSTIDFGSLPPDGGIVSPIARPGLDPPPEIQEQLNVLTAALPAWQPGNVTDPVQRVRNLMFIAAVPDVLEMEILEGYVPLVVFDRLKQVIPKKDLIRILYWVATHPSGGDDSAAGQLQTLGLGNATADRDTARERVTLYSAKLLGRLVEKIPSR